jgi:hypothetical protein
MWRKMGKKSQKRKKERGGREPDVEDEKHEKK